MRVIFNEWDVDGDGSVNRVEFGTALRKMGLRLPQQALNDLFDAIDTNNGNTIDYNELKQFMLSGRPSKSQFAKSLNLQRNPLQPQNPFSSPPKLRSLRPIAPKPAACPHRPALPPRLGPVSPRSQFLPFTPLGTVSSKKCWARTNRECAPTHTLYKDQFSSLIF